MTCEDDHDAYVYKERRSSGKNLFAYFPYIGHLSEVTEPNLMELNLSENTVTSFHSIEFSLT
jgi:hypothetical protein